MPHFDVTSVTPSQNAAGYAHTARGPAGPSPRLGRTSRSQLLGVFVSVRTCVYLCTEGVRGGGPSLLSPGGRCGGRRSSAQGSHSLEVLSAQDSVGRAVTLLSAWSRSSPGGPSWSRRSHLRLSVPRSAPFPTLSPLDAFSSAGSFRSVLSEIGRGIPEQDGTPSRGELGRRQENRRHVSFRLAVMTLLKHLNRVFLVRGRKKKFVWGVCHWRVFAPLIVHSRAAPAFLHAVNVRILSRRTARRAPAPPAFSQLKLVASVAQETSQGSGQWVCRWPAAPDDLLFV